jgi:uncharacterized protein (DUF305 family)
MKRNAIVLALTASGVLFAGAVAWAQSAAESGLPAACTGAPHMMMEETDKGSMMQGMEHMDGAHQDMMMSMDRMHGDMMQGMQATDIDVAFVCGMIPHHQGAIEMAKAELAHGDDPWVKELAQKVIDAQQKEIAEMLEWLEKQPD